MSELILPRCSHCLELRIVLALFLPSLCAAQQWQHIGLSGEKVGTIVIDRKDDNTYYAGSHSDFSAGVDGRIFKTTDAGVTWDTVFWGGDMNQILIDPSNSNILYAALGIRNLGHSGILRTTDAGHSWYRLDPGLGLDINTGVLALAIDSRSSNVLYAGTGGSKGGSIFKSTDSGSHWKWIGDSAQNMTGNVTVIGLDPRDPDIIFVNNDYWREVFKTMDGGLHWDKLDFHPSGARAIAFSKVPCTVLMGSGLSGYPTGMFKSTDGGTTWANISDGLPPGSRIRSLASDTFGIRNKVYIGLFVINSDFSPGVAGIYFSDDNADSWKPLLLDTVDLEELAVPAGGQYILAAVPSSPVGREHGVYRITTATSVTEKGLHGPADFQSGQNYPNPFNGSTLIAFDALINQTIRVLVYDILGREIIRFEEHSHSSGRLSLLWDGKDAYGSSAGSGVYIARIEAVAPDGRSGINKTLKVVLAR